ncbi:MAG TPA: SHOCT domain-containing protein [Pyrinomonadaceae bacterium]|nr:SHOCT domain-containing protein [Pyrinomonadaceae bacterium]
MNTTILFYLQSGGDSTGVVCCGGIILLIVVIVIAMVNAGNEQAKQLKAAREEQIRRLNAAKDAYFNALKRLKANPTSADLRESTLQLGRKYSNLTRNDSGVTVYDEVALSNDINAACAGATILVDAKSAQPQTIESRLQKLVELKSKGLIDEQEYAARREKILDEV